MYRNKIFKRTIKNFTLPIIKRFYIEGCKLKYDCPQCNKILTCDLDNNYLLYPKNNSIYNFTFYCDNCFGEYIASFKFDFSVTVTEIN